MSIERYIVCLENCSLRHIESLAMIGLAEKAETVNCEKENFQRIILYLVNGKSVTSECFYHEEVKQTLKIVNMYIEFARKANLLGKLTIVESWEKLSSE